MLWSESKPRFLSWDEEGIETTAKTWGLSEERKQDLIELGKRVEGVDWKDDVDGLSGRNGPAFLVRFLISGKSVEESDRRFRQMIQYGKDLGIETLEKDGFIPPPEFIHHMRCGVLEGKDYAGDMILVRCLPDIPFMLRNFTEEQIVKYMLYWSLTREAPRAWEVATDTLARSCFFINDMKSLSAKDCTREVLRIQSKLTTIQQELHPEGVKKIVIVNAPRVFYYAYSIVKVFLKKRVREKVTICSSEAMSRKVLSKYMDLELIPSCVLPEGKGKSILPLPDFSMYT